MVRRRLKSKHSECALFFLDKLTFAFKRIGVSGYFLDSELFSLAQWNVKDVNYTTGEAIKK